MEFYSQAPVPKTPLTEQYLLEMKGRILQGEDFHYDVHMAMSGQDRYVYDLKKTIHLSTLFASDVQCRSAAHEIRESIPQGKRYDRISQDARLELESLVAWLEDPNRDTGPIEQAWAQHEQQSGGMLMSLESHLTGWVERQGLRGIRFGDEQEMRIEAPMPDPQPGAWTAMGKSLERGDHIRVYDHQLRQRYYGYLNNWGNGWFNISTLEGPIQSFDIDRRRYSVKKTEIPA